MKDLLTLEFFTTPYNESLTSQLREEIHTARMSFEERSTGHSRHIASKGGKRVSSESNRNDHLKENLKALKAAYN
jgi:hypothetical protein